MKIFGVVKKDFKQLFIHLKKYVFQQLNLKIIKLIFKKLTFIVFKVKVNSKKKLKNFIKSKIHNSIMNKKVY